MLKHKILLLIASCKLFFNIVCMAIICSYSQYFLTKWKKGREKWFFWRLKCSFPEISPLESGSFVLKAPVNCLMLKNVACLRSFEELALKVSSKLVLRFGGVLNKPLSLLLQLIYTEQNYNNSFCWEIN